MTAAAKFGRHAKIETDRLGVTNMQIAVRLRWEAGDHRCHLPGRQISADLIANKIARRLVGRLGHI